MSASWRTGMKFLDAPYGPGRMIRTSPKMILKIAPVQSAGEAGFRPRPSNDRLYNGQDVIGFNYIPITSSPPEFTASVINGAKNTAYDGISLNTNASFELALKLNGSQRKVDAASMNDDVALSVSITPEAEDIGKTTDIIIVSLNDFTGLTMMDPEGNFVRWNGSLKMLVPHLEGVALETETSVDIFTGQFGFAGNQRIFAGFLVDTDTLYFTPKALRFDVTDC